MIGKSGGYAEEQAASWIEKNNPEKKPTVSYIAGIIRWKNARRMGIAGAIVVRLGKETDITKCGY